jgi:hypothetical protein
MASTSQAGRDRGQLISMRGMPRNRRTPPTVASSEEALPPGTVGGSHYRLQSVAVADSECPEDGKYKGESCCGKQT